MRIRDCTHFFPAGSSQEIKSKSLSESSDMPGSPLMTSDQGDKYRKVNDKATEFAYKELFEFTRMLCSFFYPNEYVENIARNASYFPSYNSLQPLVMAIEVNHQRFYSRFMNVARQLSSDLISIDQDMFKLFIKKHLGEQSDPCLERVGSLIRSQSIVHFIVCLALSKQGEPLESLLTLLEKPSDPYQVYESLKINLTRQRSVLA